MPNWCPVRRAFWLALHDTHVESSELVPIQMRPEPPLCKLFQTSSGSCAVRFDFASLSSIHSDDSRLVHQRLLIHVLMTMEEKPRLYSADVSDKRFEAKMNVIVSVVNVPW